ncbi:DUF5064 family protein [Pseudomonas cavernae]|uniref:DUF5064 family protein n=1 Tax=Pseudomonas cavernae TaxID=2320867 RepID=A0A385Z7J0_9PSED|nr:DUF5064 family protein [Pseudomonas cavernae]AYC33598.1 DUF5064 family protein [Pseudomonas cavernae]
MFQPGHLHCASRGHGQRFDLHLRYSLRDEVENGRWVDFDLRGSIAGRPFHERFELPRELACNFASAAMRVASKHGLRLPAGTMLFLRDDYEAMFCDLRRRLKIRPGEPLDLQRLADLTPAQPRCAVAESIIRH